MLILMRCQLIFSKALLSCEGKFDIMALVKSAFIGCIIQLLLEHVFTLQSLLMNCYKLVLTEMESV